MDDDLLADDGQYKDDGLDDLDIDAEAALLGLSDEDIEDERSQNDEQELEFVDEDGNPVTIGENNADLYEVANIESDKLSNTADEDVLELDLDAELESFQETSDLLRESPTPTKSYNNDRQRKENLISLTNRKEIERPVTNRKEMERPVTNRKEIERPVTNRKEIERPVTNRKEIERPVTTRKETERPPARRKESQYTPTDKEQDRSSKELSYATESHSSHVESRDSFDDDFEYDEESEDENIADDHRERFKSERSNIITLTPAKRRTDIPDTLESVISVEETAKVQAFLENEQKRKMRFKGKMQGRMKPSPCFQRPSQNYPSNQGQPPQFSSSSTPSVSQPVSTAPQPRKILINPHFRGLRIPPPTESAHTMHETQVQAPLPPTSYEASNFAPPPVQYSHQEPVHHMSAPPPIYTAPPPTVQYKPPEYPPPPQQPPLQQIPPPTWQQQQQAPEMPLQSYSMPPPPVINYGDPVQQPQGYNTYGQNFQNTSYQNPPMLHPSPPQAVNYSQPPPPVHSYTQSFPVQPINPVSSSISHTQFSPPPSQIRMQTTVQQQHYQDTPVHQQRASSLAQKPRFSQNNQRFSRPPEKRPSNMNIKHVPMKQPRLEHPVRKTNVHVNNSNIREIPLVDTLPAIRKPPSANKTVPIVEEEDEKTKELRMKIEEQKLLREQILKRKEERRRQMAAQRLMELKKRQAEQNKNTVIIIPKNTNQNNQVKTVSNVKQPVVKPSVKERIGPLTTPKKKIVVVRKKIQQQNTAPTSTTNIVAPKTNISKPTETVGQRIKLTALSQKPNNQQSTAATGTQQNNLSKQTTINKPATVESAKLGGPSEVTENKTQVSTVNKNSQPLNQLKKSSMNTQAQKIKNLRLGYRPGFQRPQFSPLQRMARPRVPGPRGSQFPSPSFRDPRMHFPSHGPPPINDIRMPPHRFQEPRPPLLSFRPPGPSEHGPFHPSGPPEHGPFHPSGPPEHGPFHPSGPPEHGPFHSSGPPEHGPFHPSGPPEHGPFHPTGPSEHGPFHRFFPPDMPRSPPFHMRSPGSHPGPGPGPNFRPRGMEPRMFHERFPPPQFRNQMPPMRHMLERNAQRFQRPPRFQPQGKQNFSPSSSTNKNTMNQPKVAEAKPPTPTPTPVSAPSASSVNQKSNDSASKANDGKTASKIILTRNQPKNILNDKDVPKTQSVSIENLSSSTSEVQLRKLCSAVGVVENIQLLKSERKAVIKFKEPRQALMFQKKYQRTEIGLLKIPKDEDGTESPMKTETTKT